MGGLKMQGPLYLLRFFSFFFVLPCGNNVWITHGDSQECIHVLPIADSYIVYSETCSKDHLYMKTTCL